MAIEKKIPNCEATSNMKSGGGTAKTGFNEIEKNRNEMTIAFDMFLFMKMIKSLFKFNINFRLSLWKYQFPKCIFLPPSNSTTCESKKFVGLYFSKV